MQHTCTPGGSPLPRAGVPQGRQGNRPQAVTEAADAVTQVDDHAGGESVAVSVHEPAQPAEVVGFTDFDDMEVKIDGKPYKAFLVGLSPLGDGDKARLEKLRKIALVKLQKNALSTRLVTRRGDAIGLSVDTFMHHKNDFGHPWDPGAYPYCWSGWGAYNLNAWFLHTSMTTPQDNFGGNERYREQFADVVKNIDLAAMAKLQTTSLTPAEFRMAGPFAGQDMLTVLARECGPEKGAFNPKQVFQGAEPGDKIERPVIWGKIRSDAKSYFDLAALLGKDGKNAASYMYAEFDSPTEHYAEIALSTGDGAKLWVNGKEVFKTEKTRVPAPGQDKVAIKLKKGTNAVLLKVANGDSVHGFHFTLRSKEVIKLTGSRQAP